jgi:lipopolysaccharide export system ATP-binding protein
MDLLEVDSVVKSFDGVQLLTDIFLKCQTGDVIGLLGRNGTGKSTLLKIIFGTSSSENKFIRINGQVYDKPYQAADLISYLPQQSFIPKRVSIKTAASLFLGRNKIDAFFDDPVLGRLRGSDGIDLSGGEKRYFEIKLLLSLNSKFVLLDEPYNGLSPVLIQSVKELVTKRSSSKGIIMTDHDYRNVIDISTKNYLLFDGGIREFKDKYALVKFGYISESKYSENHSL